MRRLLSISLATLICATTVSAQLTTESIVVEGVTRTFLQYLPTNFSPSETMPLVLCFHGGSGTANDQLAIGDLRDKADSERFVLVYPQALPDPNDGGSTNWQVVASGELPFTSPNPHSDINFTSALIAEMGAQHSIDLTRVYAMGYSNGGGFVYDLACRLNNQITGIGAVARTMYAESYANCATSHPTPVVTILGTNDFISNYDGVTYQGTLYFHSSDEGNALWIERNGLLEDPEVTAMPNLSTTDGSSVEQYKWADAEDCIELTHYKVNGGDHDWPGSFGNMDIVSHEVIWDHLKEFNMEGKISCDFAGCMDQEACNFDPAATEDDGSCLEPDECGICGGSGIAEGYCDCDGNVLDAVDVCGGSCLEDDDDNGVCDDQEVYGCTYPLAENFSSTVTRDDGSCIFPCEGVVNTNVFDWDGDYVVTVTDFLMMLSVYGDTDVDLDGVWDSGDNCVDTNACNYANDPSEPCTYIDILGVCGGGCEADEDNDGICDDIDNCIGVVDECGVCNGPGPTEVVIDQIITTYDSIFLPVDGEWFVYAVEVDTTFSITCAQDENLVINELNWVTGPDNGQFVELYGEPGLDLSSHSVVFVRPVFQSGGVYEAQVDFVVGLDGQSLDADGFALVDGFSLIGNVVGVVLAASPAGDFVEGEAAMFEDVVDAILYGNIGTSHPQMSPLVASINPLATRTLHESGDGVFTGTDGWARVPDGGEPMDQMFVLQANSPGTTNQLPNEMPFTCSDPLGYQGYEYATVLIGEQCWFAENLRNENYDNGDAIPAGLSDSEWENTSLGAVAVYGEGSSLCGLVDPDIDACDESWSLSGYGRLYNWQAVDDSRGLCPSDWHVPTNEEWTVMTDFLGSSAAEKMKTTYGWFNGGNGTNVSGFSGLPGGCRRPNGIFDLAVDDGYWWSSSLDDNSFYPLFRYLDSYHNDICCYSNEYFEGPLGFSVRCIRDAE